MIMVKGNSKHAQNKTKQNNKKQRNKYMLIFYKSRVFFSIGTTGTSKDYIRHTNRKCIIREFIYFLYYLKVNKTNYMIVIVASHWMQRHCPNSMIRELQRLWMFYIYHIRFMFTSRSKLRIYSYVTFSSFIQRSWKHLSIVNMWKHFS